MLELEDVVVRLGGRVILDGISTTLEPGAVSLLLGRSGTGKSVLLKAATGFLPMERGTVRLQGVAVDPRRDAARIREKAVLVHQDPALLDEETVLDNVALPLRWRRGLGRKAAEERAMHELARVGAQHRARDVAVDLSAGERKLVALARALAVEPTALLLDEPTTGLDLASAARVGRTCGSIAAGGTALLVVTHDVEPFRDVASQVCVLGGGRMLSAQSADEAFRHPSAALHQLLTASEEGPLTAAAQEP
ncbi:MAG: ATP-binding cassette domain-containing protein [Myxococcota bacterium]